MLIVTELSEAMNAYRHVKITTTPSGETVLENTVEGALENFREEIADTSIRIFHMCGALGIDLEEEIERKMATNEKRPIKHGKQM